MSEYIQLAFLALVPLVLVPRLEKPTLYVAAAGVIGYLILRLPALGHAVMAARMYGS